MMPYVAGYELAEDEYLLKIRKGNLDTGFFTKLTKKGIPPKPFTDWGSEMGWVDDPYGHRYKSQVVGKELPIYVFKEIPRTGWKLKAWRFGQSQNWATVIHPEGFTLEIYLQHFLDIVKTHTIINGEILGLFYWNEHKLIEID